MLDSCSSSRLTAGWKSDVLPATTEPVPGDKIGIDLVNAGKGVSIILTSPRAPNNVTDSWVIREWDASISGVLDGVEISPISSKIFGRPQQRAVLYLMQHNPRVGPSVCSRAVASSPKFDEVTAVAAIPDLKLYRSMLIKV